MRLLPRRRRWPAAAALATLLVSAATSLASEGDRSHEYKVCVDDRYRDVCGPDGVDDGMTGRPVDINDPNHLLPMPLALRLTRWDCLDDCKYHCTHKVTNDALRRVAQLREEVHRRVLASEDASSLTRASLHDREQDLLAQELAKLAPVQKQMVQFYGKWVFIRVLGAQEPLSVLFSLANLVVHAAALFKLRRQVPDVYPLKLVYLTHALINVNAWTWSAVFHTRDKPFTERMDYFSAAAVMLSGLFFTICRLRRWAPGSTQFATLLRVFGALYALHVLYLSLRRFDYGYNMTANVIVGLSHNILWLFFSLRPQAFGVPLADRRAALRASKPRSPLTDGHAPPAPVVAPTPPMRSPTAQLQLLLALMTGAALLELFDFPPLFRAIDAHCLWHLATVPIAHMWYEWLIDDARTCVASGHWIGEASHAIDNVLAVVEASVGRARSFVKRRTNSVDVHALGARINAMAGRDILPLAAAPNGESWHREQEKAKELSRSSV